MRTISVPLLGLLLFAAISEAVVIKAGDVIAIAVQGHPEYSGNFTISENGTCDYPLLSDEIISNVTTAELMRDLTLRLAKYLDNPQVTIAINEHPEITVTLLGQIAIPGPVKSYDGVTLQEAIKIGGEPTKQADLARIKIVRKNAPASQAEFCNLDTFMLDGNLDLLPRLHDGDQVIVMTKKRSTNVKVIGAVQRPGFFEPEEKVNLFELIYLAGGPAEKADLSRVRRFFKHDGKTMEEVVDLQAYIDKGTMDEIPMINEGDVIIVYTKWFDWRTLLTILNNTLLFIVTIQAFSGVFK